MADQTPTRTNEEKAVRNWIVRALSGVIDASFINYAPLRGPKVNANDFVTVQVTSRQNLTHQGNSVNTKVLGEGFEGKRQINERIRGEINIYGPNHAQHARLITQARWADNTFDIETLTSWQILTGLAGEDWRGRSRAEIQFIWSTTSTYTAEVIEAAKATITQAPSN